MCEWCDENGGEPISCQDCGKLLCWDHKGIGDDIIGQPYVTNSGDVLCVECGSAWDRAEEEHYRDEDEGDGWMNYPSDWYDKDMDMENEESNGVYIGEREDDDE